MAVDTSAVFNADGSANSTALTAMIEGYGAQQGRSAADLASTASTDIPYWSAKVAAGGPSQLAYWAGRMADPPGKGTNAPGASQQQQQALPQVDPSTSAVPTIASAPSSIGPSSLNNTSVPIGLQGTPATQQSAINSQMQGQ